MKSTIKIGFLLLFMFLTTNSFAQMTESTIENRVDRLSEYLELDLNQKVALTIIFSQYENQLRLLRLQLTKGKAEDKEAYRQALKDQDQALLDVFNLDQKTKYINLRRGRRKLHEGRWKEKEMRKRMRKNRKIEAKGKYAKKKNQPMMADEYLIDK